MGFLFLFFPTPRARTLWTQCSACWMQRLPQAPRHVQSSSGDSHRVVRWQHTWHCGHRTRWLGCWWSTATCQGCTAHPSWWVHCLCMSCVCVCVVQGMTAVPARACIIVVMRVNMVNAGQRPAGGPNAVFAWLQRRPCSHRGRLACLSGKNGCSENGWNRKSTHSTRSRLSMQAVSA